MGSDVKDLDIVGILQTLPHRYPFIMVDRVLEVEPGKHIKAIKNVTINEPFFQGHFPGQPVMPGVMIMEGLAQAAAIMAYLEMKDKVGESVVYFAGMDKVRFRKVVVPGDQLILEATNLKRKMRIWTFETKAYVDGKVVAQAELKATFS